MSAYMFNAAWYCEDCARDLPREPDDGQPHDSGDYAISYPDAGEADSPQHCDACHVLLDCSLTDDGRDYVRDAIEDGTGDPEVLALWRETFDVDALDFGARYSVDGYSGIAWYLLGYVERDEIDPDTGENVTEWSGIRVVDRSMVRAVMVGDDRVHEIDVDDLTELGELDYCAECGQIGCAHDGRDRD